MQLPEHDYELILVLSIKVSPAVYRIAKKISQNKKRGNFFINGSNCFKIVSAGQHTYMLAVAYMAMYIVSLMSIIAMNMCDCGNKHLGVHVICSHYCIRVCMHESLYSSYIGYSYNTH